MLFTAAVVASATGVMGCTRQACRLGISASEWTLWVTGSALGLWGLAMCLMLEAFA